MYVFHGSLPTKLVEKILKAFIDVDNARVRWKLSEFPDFADRKPISGESRHQVQVEVGLLL